MNRFIGLAGHSSSCTFAVLSEKGKTLRTDVVETNGQSLVEYLRLIPGRLHLCLEEGTQSQWLFELLAPHTHEIAVVSGEKNQGDKSDERDALGFAERMRTGALGAKIFKAPLAFTSLRDLARKIAEGNPSRRSGPRRKRFEGKHQRKSWFHQLKTPRPWRPVRLRQLIASTEFA